ncbi:MFS family permease [Sphingomonas jinjuensis]|uniref:MFS family permease n=1 Tax=Sphingomonas jinjuensis TaxID=535907 RepID=A0A840FIZ7_9SPHN|nr:MFS transporter [Sphingomonas jinjuensis]MBB4153315.1 MFS family permease [Sphingomonas jinjuensis]
MATAAAPMAADRRPAPVDAVKRPLDALNFFLADVRDGLGPYLAIYLVAVRGPTHGWNEATAGLVMTIAGLAGLVATTPAGALVDKIRAKRALLVVAALIVTLASVSLPFVHGFALVTTTQALAAAAGAVFAPAITAVTLGIVGPKAFTRRVGRNEAFNHAGNAVAAALAGVLAWKFGPQVVFWLMGGLALLSIGATLTIPADRIDHDVARGLCDDDDCAPTPPPSAWKVLTGTRALLVFALGAFAFHLANAAMLPSVGQLLAREVGSGQATSLIAACIVGAQLVMVPVAILVGRFADRIGHKPILIAGFAVLALRGALYTLSNDPWWLLGVQLLDGVGAGIFGALLPVVVAAVTRGSGRFNVAQGAVATVQGLGAALSTTIAGALIVWGGYATAFLALAAIAGAALVLFWFAMPETAERGVETI